MEREPACHITVLMMAGSKSDIIMILMHAEAEEASES